MLGRRAVLLSLALPVLGLAARARAGVSALAAARERAAPAATAGSWRARWAGPQGSLSALFGARLELAPQAPASAAEALELGRAFWRASASQLGFTEVELDAGV